MNTILVWKEQLQIIYAKYSTYIEIGMKFLLGILVFGMTNSNIGFMESAASKIVTLGLSFLCAFLPMTIMVVSSTMLVLLHLYKLSIAAVAVAALTFFILYIFFLRFSYNKTWLVLLTAVAFALKVPFVIPVAVGLLATPITMIPVVCGTVAYYLLHYVKTYSNTFAAEGINAIMEITITCAKQIFTGKEMWIMITVIGISILLVYGIRTRFFDHAWKIASAAGAVIMVVICITGNIIWNLHISYVFLIVNGVLAVAAGLLLEVLFFAVDYSRTEQLEFEDDEYHYYVKAVPKYAVTVPEKNVKQIVGTETNMDKDNPQEAEDLLLTRSLSKELGIDSSDRE